MSHPSECAHSLGERETACADGMCPLCMAARIRALEAENKAAHEGRRVLLAAMEQHEKDWKERIEKTETELALMRLGVRALISSDEEVQKARAVARAKGLSVPPPITSAAAAPE